MADAPRRTPAERLIRAVPWLALGLGILVFYWVEASLRTTPWVFTDELQWTQLSRAIAATGHAARRGQPTSFASLYSYLIAPAWWFHSTATAYAAIKYLNAVVMCLAAVPTYLLARLLVARRAAVAVALLSIAIPAMTYAASIVPESLAYLWFMLTAWLAVRALAAPTRSAVVLAVGSAAVGPLIRQEFLGLPVSLVLAAAGLWVLRGGGMARRLPWRRVLIALVAIAIFGYVFARVVVEHYEALQVGAYLNRHTLREGGLAAGALAIGLGVLPVIGGIASLHLRERRDEPAYRAFALYLAASIVTLWLYTAGKATFLLGSTLGSLIEERNLFYLSPLLLLGTALALGARRLDWLLVAAATVLVLVLVWSRMFQVGAPYFEAPGLAILTLLNRDLIWTVQDFHRLLVGAAIVSLALLALRGRRWVPALAAVLTCAWLLTGQIYETSADISEVNTVFAPELTPPRDWVDQATHGKATTFLAETVDDPNPLLLLEFWNRSLHHMASFDGTAKGPGPTFAPGLSSTDGTIQEYTGDPYTLVGNGVVLAAPVVATRPPYTLYSTPHGWRLLSVERNVYTDGWGTNPILFTYFAPGGPGVLIIHLSRTAYTGPGRPGVATIRVGTVKLNQYGGPVLARMVTVAHAVVPNGKERTVRVPVAATPVAVSISVTNTISPPGDSRKLAAQPGFTFVRDGVR